MARCRGIPKLSESQKNVLLGIADQLVERKNYKKQTYLSLWRLGLVELESDDTLFLSSLGAEIAQLEIKKRVK